MYTYVGNNPVNYVDPIGHTAVPAAMPVLPPDIAQIVNELLASGQPEAALLAAVIVAAYAPGPGPSVCGLSAQTQASMVCQEDMRRQIDSEVEKRNGANGYKSPDGGGGSSDKRVVDGRTITFGHGGRRDLPGFNNDQVNAAIAKEVAGRDITQPGLNKFDMWVGQHRIEVRAFLLPDGTINVGTYIWMESMLSE